MIQVSSNQVVDQKSGDRTTFLTDLLRQRPSLQLATDAQGWLQTLRDQATNIVHELKVPSTREEEWRFTDLAQLSQTEFVNSDSAKVSLQDIEPHLLTEAAQSRLVFVNGVYAPDLSAVQGLPDGLVVGHLGQVSEGTIAEKLPNYFAKQPKAEDVFTALNTASFADVAIVYVPKNLVVEAPIHLLFISTTGETATFSHPRCLVIAEASSSLTLVEEYTSPGQGVYLTNAVTEIWIAENAEVKHTRIQRDSEAAFHIGKTAVSQARDSRYTHNAITLGAKLSRHNPEIYQTGEQTSTILNGLTMIRGEQLADTHSTIAFSKPYGSSNQLHKCIVDDRAHAVFNGKVFVPKAAQLTDAGQLNRNLLLSPKARVDTKPQLEIIADNVKCTHGAAVGQLDTEEVFYLQSRGLDKETAQKLLVYAFAYEMIEQVTIASLQEKLAQTLSRQPSTLSPQELTSVSS
jgi:Fe-S cluster assembly protein SufD